MFDWLKAYMPRGLYGRAALILLVPMLLIQLTVSIVFVQRHFEGVTQQMSGVVRKELGLIIRDWNQDGVQGQGAEIARFLGYDITPNAQAPRQDTKAFYDLTGSYVIRELKRHPNVRGVALPSLGGVILGVEIQGALYAVEFDRARVSARNAHQLFVNMVFYGGVFTLIAFLYLRNQLRPIKRLATAAEAFGRGVNMPYKPSGAIEVRAAGLSFLNMRARIERHIEQRTMLLSGVSHDLKTPLTRLKLGVSMLDAPERPELEQDIADMQNLLDEFLVYAQGLSDYSAEFSDVNVAELCADYVRRYAREGKTLVATHSGLACAQMREVAVQRALDNLLSNAFRYGTQAKLSVHVSETTVLFCIEDDGPSIPSDRRDEALKPFSRLDPARNQNKGSGVGLGLAIVVDIARYHGGSLRLDDSPELGGLKAVLTLATGRRDVIG